MLELPEAEPATTKNADTSSKPNSAASELLTLETVVQSA
jgi:hypothetical protein